MIRKVLVVDVETTGLDPVKNACIELGAVMLDETLAITQQFSSLVAPWDGAITVEEAMKVNCIDPISLREAPSISDVVRRFHEEFCQEGDIPLLAGWNVWLDASFLRDLYRRASLPWPFSPKFQPL
jgi:DNA polymerase III epsilon subunit-like protein